MLKKCVVIVWPQNILQINPMVALHDTCSIRGHEVKILAGANDGPIITLLSAHYLGDLLKVLCIIPRLTGYAVKVSNSL